jgi:6-phosphofructokinase 1
VILGAARCPEFCAPEARRSISDLLAGLKVTGLVVCGGDGSLAGAARLAEESCLRVIGIPAAVANDLAITDVALGFDTSANMLTWAVGQFADSATGGRRVMVIEVAGRSGGDLARLTAVASGAEIVVTPERGPLTERKVQGIARRLERAFHRGRPAVTVLVAEGVELESSTDVQGASPAAWLARRLEALFHKSSSAYADVEFGSCILGRLQRGGVPSVADRALAVRFASAAWQALMSNRERSGVLGIRNGSLILQDFPGVGDPERALEAQQLYKIQKDMAQW